MDFDNTDNNIYISKCFLCYDCAIRCLLAVVTKRKTTFEMKVE